MPTDHRRTRLIVTKGISQSMQGDRAPAPRLAGQKDNLPPLVSGNVLIEVAGSLDVGVAQPWVGLGDLGPNVHDRTSSASSGRASRGSTL